MCKKLVKQTVARKGVSRALEHIILEQSSVDSCLSSLLKIWLILSVQFCTTRAMCLFAPQCPHPRSLNWSKKHCDRYTLIQMNHPLRGEATVRGAAGVLECLRGSSCHYLGHTSWQTAVPAVIWMWLRRTSLKLQCTIWVKLGIYGSYEDFLQECLPIFTNSVYCVREAGLTDPIDLFPFWS